MKKKRRKAYWLVLLLTLGFAAVYTHHRDLPVRYQKHLERQRLVEATREESAALRERRSREERRAKQLVTDPLEIESAIREHRQRVRPGETVFRIEEVPAGGSSATTGAPWDGNAN